MVKDVIIVYRMSPRIEVRKHAYAFCGLSEDDPRASSMGRRGTEAIPFGDVC